MSLIRVASVVRRSSMVQRRENSLLVAGGLGVAALAFAGQQALAYYKQMEAAQPASESESSDASDPFFANFFARRFYDGPFEAKMSRREAALILGVRETTSTDRIKEAHRRILRINHPDMGGSTFLAGKINEAKDLLTKGR